MFLSTFSKRATILKHCYSTATRITSQEASTIAQNRIKSIFGEPSVREEEEGKVVISEFKFADTSLTIKNPKEVVPENTLQQREAYYLYKLPIQYEQSLQIFLNLIQKVASSEALAKLSTTPNDEQTILKKYHDMLYHYGQIVQSELQPFSSSLKSETITSSEELIEHFLYVNGQFARHYVELKSLSQFLYTLLAKRVFNVDLKWDFLSDDRALTIDFTSRQRILYKFSGHLDELLLPEIDLETTSPEERDRIMYQIYVKERFAFEKQGLIKEQSIQKEMNPKYEHQLDTLDAWIGYKIKVLESQYRGRMKTNYSVEEADQFYKQ